MHIVGWGLIILGALTGMMLDASAAFAPALLW
jgi:hypothetical protein